MDARKIFDTFNKNYELFALNILSESEGLIVSFKNKKQGKNNFIIDETEFDEYKINIYLDILDITLKNKCDCIKPPATCCLRLIQSRYNTVNDEIVQCINYNSDILLLNIIAAKLYYEQYVLEWYFEDNVTTYKYLEDSYEMDIIMNKFESLNNVSKDYYKKRASNFVKMIQNILDFN